MLSSGVSQKPLIRYLSTRMSPICGRELVDDAAAQLPFSSTGAPLSGSGSPSPTPRPLGLYTCSSDGLRLRRSGRLPQFSQITGTPARRSCGRIRCNGAIGRRAGAMSTPIWSSQPPGAQKSFCISMTMQAVRRRSRRRRCGSAAISATNGADGAAHEIGLPVGDVPCGLRARSERDHRHASPPNGIGIYDWPRKDRAKRRWRGLCTRIRAAREACMTKLPAKLWQEMTTADFAALDTERVVAVLPVAAIEQHGPHLPVCGRRLHQSGHRRRGAAPPAGGPAGHVSCR